MLVGRWVWDIFRDLGGWGADASRSLSFRCGKGGRRARSYLDADSESDGRLDWLVASPLSV